MKLFIEKGIEGGFEPNLLEVLSFLPPEVLFHEAQGLRHPAAIYYLSLQKLGGAYEKTVREYLLKRKEYFSENGRNMSRATGVDLDDLLSKQEVLLKAWQEHLEDCLLIIKTLYDPLKATKSRRLRINTSKQTKCLALKDFWLLLNRSSDHWIS